MPKFWWQLCYFCYHSFTASIQFSSDMFTIAFHSNFPFSFLLKIKWNGTTVLSVVAISFLFSFRVTIKLRQVSILNSKMLMYHFAIFDDKIIRNLKRNLVLKLGESTTGKISWCYLPVVQTVSLPSLNLGSKISWLQVTSTCFQVKHMKYQ